MHSKHQLMIAKAKEVLNLAYAPYSNFQVGVCVRADSDKLFVGCNVENASYGLTQCAEAIAIGNMVSSGVRELNDMVVLSNADDVCPPCGACRQLIREFAAPNAMIHLLDGKGNLYSKSFKELLPESFGPENLLDL